MVRHYTLREANAALRRLAPLAKALKASQERILAMRPEVEPVLKKSPDDGGSAAASRMYLEFVRFERLLESIREMGVEVKDVETGLCDFLALHEGRDIYLCWRLGETEVRWWHEIHTGVAGRRSVDELSQRLR